MSIGFDAGLGNALSSAATNAEQLKTSKQRREALATEMALRQQELAQRGQQMQMEQQRFNAELPFLQQQPQRYQFEQLKQTNPDWAGTQQGVDLATKLGIPMSQPQSASQVMQSGSAPQAQNGQVSQMPSLSDVYQSAGVYPQTGMPINPDRQNKLAADQLALKTAGLGMKRAELENDLYSQAGPLISGLTQGGNNSPAQPSTSGALPPLEQRVEGSTYSLPNGSSAQWKKSPSGEMGLVPIQQQQQGQSQQGGLTPLDRTTMGVNMLGGLLKIPALDSKNIPSLNAASKAAETAATERAKLDVKGYVSPAAELRATNAAKAASNMYTQAIQQLEAHNPGIDKSYNMLQMQQNSPSVSSWLFGKNTLPYMDAASTAKMFMERKKYDPITSGGFGMATPLGKSIAATNLANVSAMMGLNPGSRAVGVLEKLYAQHQPQWGYESPLQTYSKLRYLRDEGLKSVVDALKQPQIEPYPVPGSQQ